VAGAILKPFPQEVLEACYNAANEIYADLSKTNQHFSIPPGWAALFDYMYPARI
jgi:TRAP-type mannitol/chloroaromatic compound transport system substrate-binding protein